MPDAPQSQTSLRDMIADRIAREGPIGFADFMAAALYDPVHGYYMLETDREADYFTSVTVHPVFTEMLARHLDDVWEALGRPDPFVVVELASGDGELAKNLIRLAREHPWASSLDYLGVEPSPARRRAAERLTEGRFVASLGEIGRSAAVAVLSNELFDALPFDLARRSDSGWVEERVGLDGDSFAFVDAPATDAILAYGERYCARVPQGGRIEIRWGVRQLYAHLDRLADRVSIITIDYGNVAELVHCERLSAGTAMSFRAHRGSEDLLARPGEQDLTCHVNFSELADAGECFGFNAAPLVPQSDFLASLGIGEYLVYLQSSPGMTEERYSRERESIMRLVSPSEMGRFKVLAQSRGVDMEGLRGIPVGS